MLLVHKLIYTLMLEDRSVATHIHQIPGAINVLTAINLRYACYNSNTLWEISNDITTEEVSISKPFTLFSDVKTIKMRKLGILLFEAAAFAQEGRKQLFFN